MGFEWVWIIVCKVYHMTYPHSRRLSSQFCGSTARDKEYFKNVPLYDTPQQSCTRMKLTWSESLIADGKVFITLSYSFYFPSITFGLYFQRNNIGIYWRVNCRSRNLSSKSFCLSQSNINWPVLDYEFHYLVLEFINMIWYSVYER